MEHLRGSARPVADEPTDGELLDCFVTDRNEAAFVELVRRHGPMVHGVCRRMLENAEDVEDAFQATFMILVRKAGSIRKRDSAASWLYGVALRVARRARAALTRRRDRERRAVVPEAVTQPEEAWKDVRPVLDEAVEALPEKYRALVVLCYLQGRTYDEAARLLDLAKGTVSTRLTQARTLLRRKLTRRGLVFPVAVLATLLEQKAAPAALPPQLPPLAIEAARSAAGMGGTVSPHVAFLAQATPRAGKLAGPGLVAVLSLLLVGVGAGLLIWRGLTPAPQPFVDEGPQQVWKERFSKGNQPFIVSGLHFSPDGKLLAGLSGGNMTTHVWEIATEEEKLQVAGQIPANMDEYPRCLGFTADSRAVAIVAADVSLYDVAENKRIARYPGSVAAKLSPDAKLLASVTGDGTIHLVDVAERNDRTIAARLPLPVRGNENESRNVPLAIAPDGATLAFGTPEGTILLYDARTLEQRRRLTGNALPTLDLAFSPDGAALAALYGKTVVNEDGDSESVQEVKVWQLSNERRLTLPNHGANKLAFVPRSGMLITREDSGAINEWDPAIGAQRHRYPSSMGAARLLRLVTSPNGEDFLTPEVRGRLLIRAFADGRVLASLQGGSDLMDAAYSPDGRLLATGSLAPTGPRNQGTNQMAELKLWERVQ
jgi:RNA polymerase sigma factor (sigma-70 family)